MDEKLLSAVDAFVQANRENIVRDIKRLVDIPSVEGPAAPGAPFGPGPKAALEEALKMAQEMGLSTHNCEDHIGWAELPGTQQDKYLATITHLDVVPEGNGWNSDPYDMQVKDGWLIGRGVTDDKGPSVLCLYALKFLKEQGQTLRYPVRALLGCNEETGMEDVEYYLEHYPAPAFCFSPDAEFPLCNGEKGHFSATLASPVCGGSILDFEGGVATNAIPDRASALVKAQLSELKEVPGITLEQEADGVRVRGWGKSGHAASPEGTQNAIGLVVNYLLDNGIGNAAEQAYLNVLRLLHSAWDGSALGIQAADERFTPLTVIGGTIRMEEGRILQTMDSRFPTSTNGEVIAAQIRKTAGDAAELQKISANEPFYISPDAAPIRALIDTYNQVTGEQAEPFTIGGGTYARHFPAAVSFGPERLDTVMPDFAGPIHGANEGAELEQLLQALKVYILAMIELQQIEL